MSNDNKQSETSYLDARGEESSWLVTGDHKRIGVMYMIAVMAFGALGAVLMATLSVDMMKPAAVFDSQTFTKIFDLYGAVMVFLVVVPAIPGALGNFVLPLMLGARGVAFPRLNLWSFYAYCAGAALILGGFVGGSVLTMAGLSLASISTLMLGVNFIATIHRMRAPGLRWSRLPVFVWSIYAASVVQILATPALVVGMDLTILDQVLHLGLFDARSGGAPLLIQQLFWFYVHPAVFIALVPAFGAVIEIAAVHSRSNIPGRDALVKAFFAAAALSLLGWGQHLASSGSEIMVSVSSFFAMAAMAPMCLVAMIAVGTLARGGAKMHAPMFFVLVFLVNGTAAMLMGLALSAPSTGAYLNGSQFELGQLSLQLVGGVFVAFFAGVTHWWPKITGRMPSADSAKFGAFLIFVGANLAAVCQMVLGHQGQAARANVYLPELASMNMFASAGAFILVAGLLMVIFSLAGAARSGKAATANPWDARTLEWETSSPPITRNFASIPQLEADPYVYAHSAKPVGMNAKEDRRTER